MRGCENADARTFEQEIDGTTNHLAGFLILRIKKALGPLLIGLLFLRSLQNIPKLQIKSFHSGRFANGSNQRKPRDDSLIDSILNLFWAHCRVFRRCQTLLDLADFLVDPRHEAETPMFRFERLGAEKWKHAHWPTLTHPGSAVMAQQDSIFEACLRISL